MRRLLVLAALLFALPGLATSVEANAASIVAWGSDGWGEVSDRPAGSGYTAVAGGLRYSLALSASGSISAWGRDGSGQVSDSPAGTGYTAVAAGKGSLSRARRRWVR